MFCRSACNFSLPHMQYAVITDVGTEVGLTWYRLWVSRVRTSQYSISILSPSLGDVGLA